MSSQVSFETYGATAAESYERYFVPVIPAPLAADLITTAALRPGEHVVDIACGTGVVTRLAAQHVGISGRVVGVDPNPGMLEVARSTPAVGGAPIEWCQAGAESLPLADESFDFALCQLGLMFLDDRHAGLQEIRRTLSPGGRLAINTPGPMTRIFQIMDDAIARHVSPDTARFVHVVFSLHDPGELEGLLRDTGFREITVAATTKMFHLPEPRDFLWQYIHSTPLAAAVSEIDAAAKDGLEREVVAAWQEFVVDSRLVLHQPILVATAQR